MGSFVLEWARFENSRRPAAGTDTEEVTTMDATQTLSTANGTAASIVAPSNVSASAASKASSNQRYQTSTSTEVVLAV